MVSFPEERLSSKKIRSLSENMWISIFHICLKTYMSEKIYVWKDICLKRYGYAYFIIFPSGEDVNIAYFITSFWWRCEKESALKWVGEHGDWGFMWNVIYPQFLNFSWNFYKICKRNVIYLQFLTFSSNFFKRNVIYPQFLTFSWNFCKICKRMWHRSSIMENR